MTLEERQIKPQDLPELELNCLWLMREEEESTPGFIQLDWNMCGGLSRTVKQIGATNERSIVPTLSRIKSEFVMLDYAFEIEEFLKTCSGMKLENVAVVCKSVEKANQIASEIKNNKSSTEYPKRTVVYQEEQLSS